MKENIIDNAIEHLRKDPYLYKLILNQERPHFKKPETPFYALSKTIIFQQLSGKSADSIHKRFLSLCNDNPSEQFIIKIDDLDLKSIGLSHQKIKYLKALSSFFLENDSIDFNDLSDKEISEKLIQIKGIGQWTIDMFLMFTLLRTNILPIGDLAIKKGFKILYELDELPTPEFMLNRSKKWSPYKTIASIYIWSLIDNEDDNW